MSDEPAKITALFGNYTPSAGTTEILQVRADNAAEALRKRKMIAFGAVAIDEDGQAHMFYGRDPLRSTVLIGGLHLLQHILTVEAAADETEVVIPSPEGTTA